MDRRRFPPPPPPGSRPEDGDVLFFVVEPQAPAPPRAGPPPPPGASDRVVPLTIRRGEPLSDAIRRIGIGHLDRAIGTLSAPGGGSGVEQAGSAVDAARALLRLVRSAAGDRAYLFEDQRMRQVARVIGEARQAQAAPEVVSKLQYRLAEGLAPGALDTVTYDLAVRARPADDAAIAEALEVLVAARVRWAGFVADEPDDEFSLVEPGLRLTYAKGQLRMGEAYRHRTDASFRKWRTQVCYLRDQSTMLDPDWATLGLSERLRKLAEALSEARDLVAATETVDDEALGDDEGRELLRLLVHGRCQEIYRGLYADGARIYGDEPIDFSAEFGKYWRAWRAR